MSRPGGREESTRRRAHRPCQGTSPQQAPSGGPREPPVGGPPPTRRGGARAWTGLRGLGGETLDDGGDALADANAHGGEAVTAVAALQLVQEGGDEACAGAAERMAEGDGATV